MPAAKPLEERFLVTIRWIAVPINVELKLQGISKRQFLMHNNVIILFSHIPAV
jgi:hypothetical protein